MALEVEARTAEAVATLDLALDRYDEFMAIVGDLLETPAAAVDPAKPFLVSTDARERAAASILGRVGESDRETSGPRCAELLLDALRVETSPRAAQAMASAVGLIWTASGERQSALACARDSNPNVRRAASEALSFWATDRPDDAPIRAMLERLRSDPDEDVRRWAEFGLDTLVVGR